MKRFLTINDERPNITSQIKNKKISIFTSTTINQNEVRKYNSSLRQTLSFCLFIKIDKLIINLISIYSTLISLSSVRFTTSRYVLSAWRDFSGKSEFTKNPGGPWVLTEFMHSPFIRAVMQLDAAIVKLFFGRAARALVFVMHSNR